MAADFFALFGECEGEALAGDRRLFGVDPREDVLGVSAGVLDQVKVVFGFPQRSSECFAFDERDFGEPSAGDQSEGNGLSTRVHGQQCDECFGVFFSSWQQQVVLV